jgi:hypothetical protein
MINKTSRKASNNYMYLHFLKRIIGNTAYLTFFEFLFMIDRCAIIDKSQVILQTKNK